MFLLTVVGSGSKIRVINFLAVKESHGGQVNSAAEILDDEWFKKEYKPPIFEENGEINLDDVEAVFKDSEVC